MVLQLQMLSMVFLASDLQSGARFTHDANVQQHKTLEPEVRVGKLDNARYEAFCNEMLVEDNGTKAAIRAGYAEGSAHVTASRMLKIPKISARLAELRDERSERTQINADYVLTQLDLVQNLAIEGDEVLNQEGQQIGTKRQLSAAVAALRAMGDHVKVQAFNKALDPDEDIPETTIAFDVSKPVGEVRITYGKAKT